MIKNISAMEPMFPKQTGELVDLAMEVHREAAALGRSLHIITRDRVAELLRHINSYYSNLIEGHHTHPSDIERVVRKEYDTNSAKRRLQELSLAHIEVQQKMEELVAEHPDIQICNAEFITWIHKTFYDSVPEEFRSIKDPDTGESFLMIPGGLRNRLVTVGRHVPPDPDAISGFLSKFDLAYNPDDLHGATKLIAVAASHHRLAWIHPFLDGNGRVDRLFSHAYMIKANIESHGLWTISRGLARRRKNICTIWLWPMPHGKVIMMAEVILSERNLGEFCEFFLNTCMDQIEFMGELLDLDNLQEPDQRICGYAVQ